MRVIGGEFRSRRLKAPVGDNVRPSPDRLREALFNVLAPRIEGSVFLDAYAGCGSVGIEADKSFSPDAGKQSQRSLAIIRSAIEALGGRMEDVMMTRIYLKRIGDWEKIAAVHGDVFGDIRPATLLLEVAKLIDDAALVEIEATAIVG